MSVTITAAGGSTSPWLVQGSEATTESRNVTHTILGRSDNDYSLAPDSLRSGTHQLVYLTRADAFAALALFKTAGPFTLVDTDLPETGMRFIRRPGGRLRVALDDRTLTKWLLDVEYQEVTA